ncbi:UNVERIFIED_CONTAM: hypothetical protein FKN15_041675, partial [Acipenser sinensis]
RASAVKAVFQSLLQILSRSFEEIHAFYRDDDRRSLDTCLQLTAECFRCQRNACVQCARNQCLMRDLGFIDVTTRILQLLPRLQLVQTDSALEAFRCGIQFLGNLAVGNQDCKDDIWKHTFPDTFLNLLDHSDEKAVAYGSMVLFTCLDGEKVGEMLVIEGGQELAVRLIRLCRKQPELDWAITLLELITAELGEAGVGTQESAVPVRLAEFLATCFQDKCKVVLTLASDSSAANEVRELDGIALILDSCSIDGNNPCILQKVNMCFEYVESHNPAYAFQKDEANPERLDEIDKTVSLCHIIVVAA